MAWKRVVSWRTVFLVYY